MRFAIININSGLVEAIIDSDAYFDGLVSYNKLYKEIPIEINKDAVLDTWHWVNGQFGKHAIKPSQYHIWNLQTEQWAEPEGYLQTLQSDGSKQINQAASQKILSKYPIYKQLNIGRTPEAQVMYSWIDNIRNLSNIANANIETSTTLEQINSIVDNFKTELGNIA